MIEKKQSTRVSNSFTPAQVKVLELVVQRLAAGEEVPRAVVVDPAFGQLFVKFRRMGDKLGVER